MVDHVEHALLCLTMIDQDVYGWLLLTKDNNG